MRSHGSQRQVELRIFTRPSELVADLSPITAPPLPQVLRNASTSS
jgi:hypothetical protein